MVTICSKDLCEWFKVTEPYKRLEFICCLLNLCQPLELHFIKTCCEDLDKRVDFLEAEGKINSNKEIQIMSDRPVLDDKTRSQVTVTLALLSATNYTGSEMLFKIMTASQDVETLDAKYINEMLLLYVMVLNHPAFTYAQKRVVTELLSQFQQSIPSVIQVRVLVIMYSIYNFLF